MYLPLVSKGLKTYPGLPGTGLAVGNVGWAEEAVRGDGEKLDFTLSADELLVVVRDPPLRLSTAAADFLRGTKRTETGFGYRELYAPLTASTPAPIGPPTITLPAIAVPPVADTLLSTFTVWGIYPPLLTVTVKLSRRLFTNFVGVTPCSPEEITTFARDGSLNTVSLSCEPRVMVAQDVKRTTGRHSKTLLINRSITVQLERIYRILLVVLRKPASRLRVYMAAVSQGCKKGRPSGVKVAIANKGCVREETLANCACKRAMAASCCAAVTSSNG
jgi:hypothetical protein